MVAKFDAGYRRPYSTLVACVPRRGRVPAGLVPHGVGPDLPPRPARRIGPCPRHRPGPGHARDDLPAHPRRRGRPAGPGPARQARHHTQLRPDQRLPLLGVRPARRHPPHRRPGDHRLPQPLARHASPAATTCRPSSRSAGSPIRPTQMWKATPAGAACPAVHASATHPTFPESASASGQLTKAAAMARLCASWNAALTALQPVVTPDEERPLELYGDDDHQGRPGADPATRTSRPGCRRGCARSTRGRRAPATTPRRKRATITVTIPRAARTWPALD